MQLGVVGAVLWDISPLTVVSLGLPWDSFHCHTLTPTSKSTINFPFKLEQELQQLYTLSEVLQFGLKENCKMLSFAYK